jgi:hypothetical protein
MIETVEIDKPVRPSTDDLGDLRAMAISGQIKLAPGNEVSPEKPIQDTSLKEIADDIGRGTVERLDRLRDEKKSSGKN